MPTRPTSVDIYLTQKELDDGLKAKKTACLKVDPELLQPAACVSRQGLSSSTMFSSPPREASSPHPAAKQQMNALCQAFFGPDSLAGAALQSQNQHAAQHCPAGSAATGPGHHDGSGSGGAGSPAAAGERPGRSKAISNTSASMSLLLARSEAAVAADTLERNIRQRGAQLVDLKYVSPQIARRYGVQATTNAQRPHDQQRPTSTPASPKDGKKGRERERGLAAAAAGAAAPAQAHKAQHAPGYAISVASSGGGGAAVDIAGRQRAHADDDNAPSTSGQGGRGMSYNGGCSPGGGGGGRPGSAAFRSTTRDQASRTGSKFVYFGKEAPGPGKYDPSYGCMDKASRAADMDRVPLFDAAPTVRRRAGEEAAPDQAQGQSVQQQQQQADGAARTQSRPPMRPTSAPAAGRSAAGSVGGASSTGQHQQRQRLPSSAEAGDGQGEEEGEEPGPHRVHPRRPAAKGSPAFLAPPRVTMDCRTTAGHLFLKNYKEGYDTAIRKSSRPASAFVHQTLRPPPGTGADTPLALGPGAYLHDNIPPTLTGRHVTAGHSKLASTADWTRAAPARPGSAPAARPPNTAAAQKQGYWGPDGPSASLFPDEPQYAGLVSIQMLQEQSRQPHRLRSAGPSSRGHSHATGTHGTAKPVAYHYYHAAADAAAAAAAQPDGPPLVYLDPQDYDKVSSAGLSKRVTGGFFSQATRERTALTMRAMADGKVIPPAAVAVLTANDLTYDTNFLAEAHRRRAPSCQLPPNRNALSKKWITTAATAYM